MRAQIAILVSAIAIVSSLYAQQTASPVSIRANARGEMPKDHSATIMHAMCDEGGNLYDRPPFDENGQWTEIQKITADAQLVGKFHAESDLFFVEHNNIYVLAGTRPWGVVVVKLGQDGSVESQAKLQLDSFVHVTHFAVFESGEYLVVGLAGTITERSPHLRTPFTAVFASDGHLVKKIYEPDDEEARQHAEGSDSRYSRCCSESGNEFVGWNSDVTSGLDGNVYVLHGVSPQLVYVISPAGEVIRKFKVDSGNPSLSANSIKFYQGRLAIGFSWLGDEPKTLIKVVDLNGKALADYEIVEKAGDSDPVLACYNSSGFTLLPRWVGNKPYLLTAKVP
jgi:hypothetical protein